MKARSAGPADVARRAGGLLPGTGRRRRRALPRAADRRSPMIRRFVEFALRQSLFIWLGLAIFVGAGAIAFKNLPVEAFPDVSDTQVNVIALYPGRAAEEVEKQVTIPIEIASRESRTRCGCSRTRNSACAS